MELHDLLYENRPMPDEIYHTAVRRALRTLDASGGRASKALPRRPLRRALTIAAAAVLTLGLSAVAYAAATGGFDWFREETQRQEEARYAEERQASAQMPAPALLSLNLTQEAEGFSITLYEICNELPEQDGGERLLAKFKFNADQERSVTLRDASLVSNGRTLRAGTQWTDTLRSGGDIFGENYLELSFETGPLSALYAVGNTLSFSLTLEDERGQAHAFTFDYPITQALLDEWAEAREQRHENRTAALDSIPAGGESLGLNDGRGKILNGIRLEGNWLYLLVDRDETYWPVSDDASPDPAFYATHATRLYDGAPINGVNGLSAALYDCYAEVGQGDALPNGVLYRMYLPFDLNAMPDELVINSVVLLRYNRKTGEVFVPSEDVDYFALARQYDAMAQEYLPETPGTDSPESAYDQYHHFSPGHLAAVNRTQGNETLTLAVFDGEGMLNLVFCSREPAASFADAAPTVTVNGTAFESVLRQQVDGNSGFRAGARSSDGLANVYAFIGPLHFEQLPDTFSLTAEYRGESFELTLSKADFVTGAYVDYSDYIEAVETIYLS